MSTTSEISICPYCGSSNLFTMRCEPPRPHYAKTSCSDCKRHIRWEPHPMTPERAAAFKMPYGVHKDEPLAEIPTDYLQIMSAKLEPGTVKRAIDEHLRHRTD